MTTYQCVAPRCDNDFDRAVFENKDRWLTDAALGVEVQNGCCVALVIFSEE